ncbi:MAG: CDP-diacylglycerol--serine O-phosphatidyltransferase [Candidatus Zixiibacteriota bacterium]
MRNIRGIFPGVFTVGNMFCGFASILSSFDGETVFAAWMIILAGFFDALDGKIARFSGSASRFGVELDSFADVISFGIAPAMLFYNLGVYPTGKWGWIPGFVFVICGAFRLARFNIQQTKLGEKLPYMGLPIPTAAITLVSYTLFCSEVWGRLRYPKALITMIIAFSGLMVSGIEYETLPKFSLGDRKNKLKLVYILIFLIVLMINPRLALFPFGMLYILSGVVKGGYGLFHSDKSEVTN